MSDQPNSAGGENSSGVQSVPKDDGRAAGRPAKKSPLSKVVKWGIGIVVAALAGNRGRRTDSRQKGGGLTCVAD
jgi:hypothetical protein